MRVQSASRGFDSSNVLLLQVDLPRTYDNPQKWAAFFTEATRRIRALPGVVAVGAVSDFFIHRQPDYRIALEGQPPRRPDDPAPPLTEDRSFPAISRRCASRCSAAGRWSRAISRQGRRRSS